MALSDFLKKKELNEIKELKSQLEKYKLITDIEKETKQRQEELDGMISYKEKNIAQKASEFEKLNSSYKNSLEVYVKLKKEVSLFENKLDLIEFGIYEPVYDFEKSDDYREEQNKIIQQQKELITNDNATFCSTNWTVEGSESKGKAVIKVYKKLLLRAFNGESDVMIAKVKWNNINQMKERLQKIFISINSLGKGFHVSITKEYLNLKLKELILEYEYQSKKQEEKEKMKAIQDELREEEKARREYEKAQKDAEKQEALFQKALEKARKEFEESNGVNTEELKNQIEKLEQELKEAQEKKERALSMAQQTKRGHVYIISNIGAFGEDVYKIGMTRRLEPIDRVRELGDASVPFQFDVHAMIYSDVARTLEYELHKAFSLKKVNMLNNRKEFFKVSLEEIEEAIKKLGFEAEFTKMAEAMQYRETMEILNKLENKEDLKSIEELIFEEFPSSLELDED
jgi:hypothetical protein